MKKVLVVVDMQKDFIDGALGTQEAVAIVPHVVEKIEEAKKNHIDIYVTLDTHTEDYLNTQEGANLPVPHCIKHTKGWALDSNIQAVMDSSMYTAIEKGAFGSPDLAQQVKALYEAHHEEGVEVELVGVCTDICVITNALLIKAAAPEVKISVDASCCAGVTPASHQTALEAMKMCQIAVVNGN